MTPGMTDIDSNMKKPRVFFKFVWVVFINKKTLHDLDGTPATYLFIFLNNVICRYEIHST